MRCPKITGKLRRVFARGTRHLASGPMRCEAEPWKPRQPRATLFVRYGRGISKLSGNFAPLGWEAPVVFFDLLQKQWDKSRRQCAEQRQMVDRKASGFGWIPFQLWCIDCLCRKHASYQ